MDQPWSSILTLRRPPSSGPVRAQPRFLAVKQIQSRWDAQGIRQSFRAFDHVVLDCPPSLESNSTAQALRTCDIALIPILPSPVDLWASLRLLQEIEEARKLRPNLRAFLVLNQLEPKSAI